jgi:hypothetical protein
MSLQISDVSAVLSRPEFIEEPRRSSPHPVYLQPWFTNIAGQGSQTKEFTVYEGAKLTGSLTICMTRNSFGMKQAYNLPWARAAGPMISETSRNRRSEIVGRLIKQLPANVSYFLTLSSESDFRQFLSAGFVPDLEDNYIIATKAASVLESSFSKMTKRHLKQAQGQLTISSLTPSEFIEIYERDLAHRRRKPYAPLQIAHQILDEGLRRGQANILCARRRDNGETEAAVACLWDDTNYYYWLTTRRVQTDGLEKASQGSIKLLLWSAIQDALARGLVFDFDGIPTGDPRKRAGLVRLYEGMGAQPSVRYKVKRETRFERFVGPLRAPVKSLITNTIGRAVALKMNY